MLSRGIGPDDTGYHPVRRTFQDQSELEYVGQSRNHERVLGGLLVWRGIQEWKVDVKGRAGTLFLIVSFAFHPSPSPVRLDNPTGDCQAEAVTAPFELVLAGRVQGDAPKA